MRGPGGAGLTVQMGLFVGDELSIPKGTCSPVGCAGLFLLHPERKAERLAETSIIIAEQKPEERKGGKNTLLIYPGYFPRSEGINIFQHLVQTLV